jgi:hypothetical protein
MERSAAHGKAANEQGEIYLRRASVAVCETCILLPLEIKLRVMGTRSYANSKTVTAREERLHPETLRQIH